MAPAVCVLGILVFSIAIAMYTALTDGRPPEEAAQSLSGMIVGGGFITTILFLASLPVLIIGFILSSRKKVLFCESCGASTDSI